MAARKAKTKVKDGIVKQQSVKEFKAWLVGILEFQPDDWCPNPEQWKNIQEKIANLQDDMIEVRTINPPTLQPPQTALQLPTDTTMLAPNTHTRASQMAGGSGLDQPFNSNLLRLLPEGDGPVEQIMIPTVSQPSIETLSSTVKVSGSRIKTPHIDTSAGGYKSTFA